MKNLYLLAFLTLLFVSQSAFGQIRVRANMLEIMEVNPGDEATVEMIIENTSMEDVDVEVYQEDYFFAPGKRKMFLSPDSLDRSNASWISFPSDYVTVPAESQVSSYYTITVPPNPELSGSYWSMLLIQPLTTRVNEGTVGERTMVMKKSVRYGIQVLTHISDNIGYPDFTIENPRTEEVEGVPMFAIDVTNTGNRAIVPDVWIEIFNESGEKVSELEGNYRMLYPTTGVTYTFPVSELEPGEYSSLLLVDGREDDLLFGSRFQFTIE